VLILLIAPVVWPHYLPLAFPPILVWLLALLKRPEHWSVKYCFPAWLAAASICCWLGKYCSEPAPFVIASTILFLGMVIEMRWDRNREAGE
jgi:hypothetical protein